MQLNFLFPTNINIYDEKNFIIHDGNKDAFIFIKSLSGLNNNIFLLSGLKNSGKTYLCHIWQKMTNAIFVDSNIFNLNYGEFVVAVERTIFSNGKYILEDLSDIDENKLLYFFNIMCEKHSILLMTSKKNISDFNFTINDLKSRFNNIVNIKLYELNESSKREIILKLLADRQMNIDSEVLDFVSNKISGNYDVIFKFVHDLEKIVQNGELKKIKIGNVKNLI
ncbi:MAG: DnaA/Hda family protein [Rickettsiales bacterium]|nr:DnaA/Hda family protein [Rickettsiales bacterium]